MKTLNEPGRELPVSCECDVLVAGGGMAGVAAAVAARRQGASVLLIERYCALGGLATLGNVIEWLPICDGRGRQVIGGLGEELLRLSVHDLGRDNPQAHFKGVPPCWEPGGDPRERERHRFQTSFNPASYFFALEKWAVDAGVDLLYDTRVCALARDGERLTHVIIENKSGRSACAARVFIDATGDADLCHLAGEATVSLDSNVLCGWFYMLIDGAPHLVKLSNSFDREMTRAGSKAPFFRGDDGREVTAMILGSRELVRQRMEQFRTRTPDKEVQLFAPATLACFRATRRLQGARVLQMEDVHQWFDDACGLTGSWREDGPVWAIPWACLAAPRTPNLAVAGRCISAAGGVWDITRAIPACVVTGEAAGAAAAMALGSSAIDFRALDVAALRQRLCQQGGIIDPERVKERQPE